MMSCLGALYHDPPNEPLPLPSTTDEPRIENLDVGRLRRLVDHVLVKLRAIETWTCRCEHRYVSKSRYNSWETTVEGFKYNNCLSVHGCGDTEIMILLVCNDQDNRTPVQTTAIQL